MKELATGENKMSVINIYVNDENKVNVKDDAQIIKIKGDKGDPMRYEDLTPEQKAELKGPKGDALRYEDLTEEQKAELKGPKGDALRFEDLTEEQKAELKGQKGEDGVSASADNAYNTLLAGNVWVKDKSIDAVLVSVIDNLGKPFPRTEFTPLSLGVAVKGQTVVGVTGEPHYTVKVVGNDVDVFTIDETGVGNVIIPALGEDDVKLTYHNYMGEQVEEVTINGIVELKADEEYVDETGVKFIRYGKKLVMKLDNYNERTFNWLGKWTKDDIEELEIKSDINKHLMDFDNTRNKYDGLTFIIKKPRNIILETSNNQGVVTIKTEERNARVTLFERMGWNGTTYKSEHL